MRRILHNTRLLITGLGHFSIDLFSSQVPVLLAALSVPLALSNAQVGIAATLYSLATALTQPLFGYLADRFGSRWLGPGSLVWLAGLFGILGLIGGTLSFPVLTLLLTVAALGSGAYHPQGAMHAAASDRERQASATAIFFLFGQAGLALGPALGGMLLESVGLPGLTLLALIVMPVALGLFLSLSQENPQAVPVDKAEETVDKAENGARLSRLLFLAFALMIGFRSWAQVTVMTYLPKFYQGQGWTPSRYGTLLAIFMFASAWGGVLGGHLADHWGRKPVIVGTIFLAAIPLGLFPLAHGPLLVVLVALAGGLLGASHSLIVVQAQAMLPDRMALASGLTLGFTFASGAVGAALSGFVADLVGGLLLPLQASGLLALIAGAFSLTLKGRLWPSRRGTFALAGLREQQN